MSIKMFFRIKKIKGIEYAYAVENKWKKAAKPVGLNESPKGDFAAISKPKGSRQKVVGYIGRVYRFGLSENIDFLRFIKSESLQDYVKNNDKNKVIKDLIEWELFKFGISKQSFSIDLSNTSNVKIQKNNKNVAFYINDGFMCSLTLKRLFEFKPEGDEQSDGYCLARAFVEAGIKVPHEIFVGLFGKIYV